jgi:hypothetical protein
MMEQAGPAPSRNELAEMIFVIAALANEPCIPPPLPRTLAEFVLPVGAAPKHEDAIYTLIQVAPYGLDLHGWRFTAVAVAVDGGTPDEKLPVDVPRQISGPLSFLPPRPEEPKAFWVIRIARPRSRSRIVLSIRICAAWTDAERRAVSEPAVPRLFSGI